MDDNIKWVKLQKESWKNPKIIPVSSENIGWYTWNENSNEWEENDDGDTQGIMVWDGKEWQLYIDHETEYVFYKVIN